MTEYDPSRDDDTKIITRNIPGEVIKEAVTDTGDESVVILPDGTKPVKMGSGVVNRIVGHGGMAIVYEVWNEQLGVKRAVKLLRPNSSIENKERFEKEMKVTAQLDHPNIIDIHSVGEWNGLPYIEMEMVDGISLSELIRRQGALPLEVCTAIAIIVCRALDYTHHHEYTVNNQLYRGLLHRDLKPGNILFSREGVVRLTDFGVATPTDVAPSTSSGKVIGSMQYLAPEQLEEDDVDPRADIFSLGCILYEMISGDKTFPDRNITRLVRKRLRNEFKPLSSFDLSIPPKLDRLISDCLNLHANKRPGDIRHVLHELEKIHDEISLRSPEAVIKAYARGESFDDDSFLTQKRLPVRRVAGIALITFSVAALGTYLYFHFSRLDEETAADKEAKQSAVIEKKLDRTAKEKITKMVQQEVKIRPLPEPKESPQANQSQKTPVVTTRTPAPAAVKNAKARKMVTPPSDKSVKSPAVAMSQKKKPPKKATSEGKPSERLLDKLQKTYNTSDFIAIMKTEDAAKNYTRVLEIYKSLPRAQASSKEARLLRHRALVGTNQVNKSYFDNNHINDGEFYLSKAKFLFGRKQYQRAIWILDIIKTSPTVLKNKKELHKEVLYYLAKCQTGIFESNPTPEKKKAAQQSWFKVKNEFRNNQNHYYFKEANSEIRRLSKYKLE